ncbi:MAG TPA: AAA family ATPase [Pararhizobium sp.]|uniref:AAA family ATPase n=1 Tax=Pararhizobium sp. TaxID=1977563 RepID=UPI002BE64E1D|nr:AAA family ATPase [Pararhizobium sp.]HTO34046.1 AAA family ATPase [Pararhizobium sp.]
MLAYFLLRRALKPTRQFRGDVGGLLIVIVDKRWFHRFQRAADLLFSGQARAFFNAEKSMHRVVSKEYGSKTKLDLDLLSYNAQTILLTDNIKAIPRSVRMAADDTVTVEKPTVRLLNAVRTLAGRPCLDDRTAAAVVGEDWEVIEALICRHSLADINFDTLRFAEDSQVPEGPRLSELPGFEPAREWVSKLATDVLSWRDKTLAWSALDRGALIVGPPGVGKTMFAKALAAELGVTLIATSAGRWQSAGDGYLGNMLRAMRESFDEAQSKSPALLFIDELDSIGNREHRSSRHAYYETQVVNTFLELTSTAADWPGVILLAATNRPEDIEPAILRSGRFEEQIELGLPTPEERADILSYHLGGLMPEMLSPLTDLLDGASPADLEKLARAAKRQARAHGRNIEIADVESSMPPLIKLDYALLQRIATHECGHAMIALTSGFVDAVTVKINDTIIEGRAQSGGRITGDMKDAVLPTEKFLRARIRTALAGMAAEDVVLGNRSIGGSATLGSDLDKATRIATLMVMSYGMGDSPRFEIDYRRVTESHRTPPHLRPEIDRLLREEWDGAKDILTKHKDRLIFLAEKLVSERKMRISAM